MSLTGQDDQIILQSCYGKEGDGSSRIQINDDVGNQYEADYQRLREFADTTINQIDSSISDTVGYDGTRKKTDRKLTAKGLKYQLSLFHEKKQQLDARLARKAAAIEDLLYNNKNFITVKEELAQYDDIFKMIIENHEEHCKIFKLEEQSNEDHSENVNQRVFIFKHKVRNWLKDAKDEYDKKSKSSGRSLKGRSSKESTRSSRSSKTSSSRSSEADSLKSKVSSKTKAIEEKVRIVELLTDIEFMEKKRIIEMEAERLHIQEKLVRAPAKFKIYKDLDQMSQKAGKIEVQEDKRNNEHQLRHAQTVADKTNCYNKNLFGEKMIHLLLV